MTIREWEENVQTLLDIAKAAQYFGHPQIQLNLTRIAGQIHSDIILKEKLAEAK